MARKRKDDDDEEPEEDKYDGRQECWNCGGNCVVETTYDGQRDKKHGGTGADFESCPICKGRGYL
jgi:hypothetical protein